jgi:hypothetical protein
MFINDKYTCSSLASYGTRNEAGGEDKKHGHGARSAIVKRQKDILTVASMSDCTGNGPITVKKGDTIVLKAEYDLKKHPL